jgi:hypothetical protein
VVLKIKSLCSLLGAKVKTQLPRARARAQAHTAVRLAAGPQPFVGGENRNTSDAAVISDRLPVDRAVFAHFSVKTDRARVRFSPSAIGLNLTPKPRTRDFRTLELPVHCGEHTSVTAVTKIHKRTY